MERYGFDDPREEVLRQREAVVRQYGTKPIMTQ